MQDISTAVEPTRTGTTGDRTRYDRSRYEARREELLDLIGRRCAACGSDELIEFDHIDPRTKEYALTERWNRPMEELAIEARKCQSLCHRCHIVKSAEELSVDHGGGLSGKRNCKCVACRSRKNEYMRNWKRKRRRTAGF